MIIIDTATGWFICFEIPTYDLNEVTGSNYEYIYKSSVSLSQFFNNA